MADPTPPAPGLVRREINGLEYWFNEGTRKVHSSVKAAARVVVAPVVVVPVLDPAPAVEPPHA